MAAPKDFHCLKNTQSLQYINHTCLPWR